MSSYYRAYGLRISSDVPLSGSVLEDAQGAPDVMVRVATVDPVPPNPERRQGCFHATPDRAYLFWEQDGLYLVREGKEIVLQPVPSADQDLLKLTVEGIAFGILLHQRGLLTLHASAVALEGDGAVFLGEKGSGKSATAFAHRTRGHPIIADDVVAVRFDHQGGPSIAPGFPHLKLWPAAAVALGSDPKALPRLHRNAQKRSVFLSQGFPTVPSPIRCLYVLATGSRVEIERLGPKESFGELLKHSYAPRFLGAVGSTPTHLRQCAALAGSIPVYRLRRPPSLSVLPEVVDRIEEHRVELS